MNNAISFDEFKKTDFYQPFIKKNPIFGYLKIQITTASKSLPVANAQIVIYKNIGNYKVVFYRGVTNSSGVIEDIILPAPRVKQIGSLEIPDYTLYSMDVRKNGYNNINNYSISIYSGIESIQNIVMNLDINIENIE